MGETAKHSKKAFNHYELSAPLVDKPKYRCLSDSAKIMYAILFNRLKLSKQNKTKFSDSHGPFLCFRQKELAKRTGKSESTIGRLIGELKRSGLLTVEQRGHCKSAKLRLLEPEPITEEELAEISSGEPSEVTGHEPSEVTDYEPSKLTEHEPSELTVPCNKEIQDKEIQDKELLDKNTPYNPPKGEDGESDILSPTLEEVEQYVYENNLSFDPEEFFCYNGSIGWELNGNPVKNWKALALYWQKLRDNNPDYYEQFE